MAEILNIRGVVIKVGSKLVADRNGLDSEHIRGWAYQISRLRHDYELPIAVVSSGSMASGEILVPELNPLDGIDLQVAAMFGQPAVTSVWVSALQEYGVRAGQALYIDANLPNSRYPLRRALQIDPIVINCNDASCPRGAKEIKRSADNDWMATSVARAAGIDMIISLTSAEGVQDPHDRLIRLIRSYEKVKMKKIDKTKEGTGGMNSKVRNLQDHAKVSGNIGVIAYGRENDVIWRIVHGERLGTWVTDRTEIQ